MYLWIRQLFGLSCQPCKPKSPARSFGIASDQADLRDRALHRMPWDLGRQRRHSADNIGLVLLAGPGAPSFVPLDIERHSIKRPAAKANDTHQSSSSCSRFGGYRHGTCRSLGLVAGLSETLANFTFVFEESAWTKAAQTGGIAGRSGILGPWT